MITIVPFVYAVLQTAESKEFPHDLLLSWKDVGDRIPGRLTIENPSYGGMAINFVADDGKDVHHRLVNDACIGRFVIRNLFDDDLMYINCGNGTTGDAFILRSTLES